MQPLHRTDKTELNEDKTSIVRDARSNMTMEEFKSIREPIIVAGIQGLQELDKTGIVSSPHNSVSF